MLLLVQEKQQKRSRDFLKLRQEEMRSTHTGHNLKLKIQKNERKINEMMSETRINQ